MQLSELSTKEAVTWCPGCTNNGIMLAIKKALVELVNEGRLDIGKVVTVTGIGCHGKIFDYLNLSGFYALHGRTLPTALGIKVANPELTVIGFAGDGDTYAEGIEHFVHACRYNADIKLIVHNNQVFALTVGQATPTSEIGFKGRSTPEGQKDMPLNPLVLALISGATFVARTLATDVEHASEVFKAAILHKGFSFVDVLQPCLTFHNTVPFFKEHAYKINGPFDFETALQKSLEWDYTLREDARIPIGIFYSVEKPTYEEKWTRMKILAREKREVDITKLLKEFKC